MLIVDDCIWPWRGRRWCHLVSDESAEELHGFCEWLGVPRRAFQGDHYDLDESLRAHAILLGAEAVSARELSGRLRGAGLSLSPGGRRAFADLAPPGLVVRTTSGQEPGFSELVARWAQLGSFGDTAERLAALLRADELLLVVEDGNRIAVAVSAHDGMPAGGLLFGPAAEHFRSEIEELVVQTRVGRASHEP